MGRLKERLLTLLADENSAGIEPAPVSTEPRADVSRAVETEAAEIVPADDSLIQTEATIEPTIYTAPAAQIDYWHARGATVFLQTFLRDYDLDYSSPNVQAYNYFRIGFDEANHAATFAIDATHFYQIQFDDRNARPLDTRQAHCVLTKINQLREEKVLSAGTRGAVNASTAD